MAPSPSSSGRYLLDLADASIRRGLEGKRHLVPDLSDAPPDIREHRAAFVTVTVRGGLNGCIGSLEPVEPLGVAVPRLAWDAAFADPRLPRLRPDDYADMGVKISVLGPLEPVPCDSEEELTAQLRPGIDGLLLVAAGRRATFLPAVWASLPDPATFVHHLQAKAGLPPGAWLPSTAAYRYAVEEIEAA